MPDRSWGRRDSRKWPTTCEPVGRTESACALPTRMSRSTAQRSPARSGRRPCGGRCRRRSRPRRRRRRRRSPRPRTTSGSSAPASPEERRAPQCPPPTGTSDSPVPLPIRWYRNSRLAAREGSSGVDPGAGDRRAGDEPADQVVAERPVEHLADRVARRSRLHADGSTVASMSRSRGSGSSSVGATALASVRETGRGSRATRRTRRRCRWASANDARVTSSSGFSTSSPPAFPVADVGRVRRDRSGAQLEAEVEVAHDRSGSSGTVGRRSARTRAGWPSKSCADDGRAALWSRRSEPARRARTSPGTPPRSGRCARRRRPRRRRSCWGERPRGPT